jgi:hypothetical protein
MPRIVCMGCEKEIGLAEVPFCSECVSRMDPEFVMEHNAQVALGHLKGRHDHITNSAGGCVSWCPQCRASANRGGQL